MGRQLTIKEIAAKAGVSAGTVDRVIHNRGKVSPEKESRVRAILKETSFKLNIHTSVISIKKSYNLVICIPEFRKGEYWGAIESGINYALEEYNDLSIISNFIAFNQFDAESCRKAYSQIIKQEPDAVILGPVFEAETRALCKTLDKKNIPYAFVDSTIEMTNPVASFMADQPAGGKIIFKILNSFIGEDKDILLCRPKQVGNRESYNYTKRLEGFFEYMREADKGFKVKELFYSMDDSHKSANAIIKTLNENPDVKGIAILNSRGYFIADILSEKHLTDIKVACFDLSDNNVRCLKQGTISVLLGQRPMTQGFYAVKAIIEHLIYRKKEKTFIKMPIDILMKDNLPFYKDLQAVPDKVHAH